MVHPGFRRRGVGSELVRQAEEYLRASGAESVEAGAGPDGSGFYVGIYGGLQPSGFSESAAPWNLFFERLGYQFSTRTIVMQRDLVKTRDPVSARLIRNRRHLKSTF